MSANQPADERERMLQELLELHFGCHDDPAALQARLEREPELRQLQQQALQQAAVLEAAARPPQAPLALSPARRRWWRKAPTRLMAAAAAALLVVGAVAARWGYCAWQLHRAEAAGLQLTVSGPKAVPAGAPWSVTVQSTTLAGAAMPCTVQWRTFDDQDRELAHGEVPSDGTAMVAMAPSLTVPHKVEVTAQSASDRQQQQLLLSQANSAPLVHVSTDRPVYRPGDRVYLRAVVLDRVTLTAQDAAQQAQPLSLRVLDPKGAPVLQQGDITLQRDPVRGQVGALAWVVPQGLAGGSYEIEVSSPGGSFPPERVPVVIRDYQPPRLAKTLVLDRKTYAPGAQGTAELKVERMGGGVAAGAVVRASLVLDGDEVWHQDARLDADGRSLFRFGVPREVAQGAARFVARVSDGGVVESELKPFVVPTGKVAVACYPEGGELLAGVDNRVYLECTDPLGRPVDGDGRIVAADGSTVASFHTAHQGRATATFTPRAGVAYSVRLDGKDDSFALPAVRSEGVALRALDDGVPASAPLRLHVAGNGNGPWLVAAFCRGLLLAQSTLRPDADGRVAADLELPLPATAAGVLRVTVFDRQLHPVAERLLQRASTQQLEVALQPLAGKVAPGGSQSIAVQTRDEHGNPVAAVVGLTVTDRAALLMGDEPAISLRDQDLLFADVERIEDLGDFFAGGEHGARNADLLLGTRGWRRFVWRNDDAAQQRVAAHGPWAAGVLAREGFSHTPQVHSSGEQARAAVATLEREARAARRDATVALGLGLLVLLALLVGELAAGVVRRGHGSWPLQLVGAAAGVLVLAIAAEALLVSEPTAYISPGAVRHFAAADGAAVPVAAEVVAAEPADPGAKAAVAFDVAGQDEAPRPFHREVPAPVPGGGGGPATPGPAGPGTPGPQGNDFYLGDLDGPGRFAGFRARLAQQVREYAHRRSGDATRADFTETVYWHPLLLTDARGEAKVTFDVSDAVTTWVARADAHADAGGSGRVGSGEAQFDSVLPFHLEAKLPTEMSAGDRLQLPVAFTLEDGDGNAGELRSRLSGPLAIDGNASLARVPLQDGRGRYLLPVTASAGAGEARLSLSGTASRFQDQIEQTITVVPRGFPHRQSWGGNVGAAAPASLALSLPSDLAPGSGHLLFKLFPSPLASLGEGLQGLLREPCGCFEQASSSNYPNALVLGYLQACGDEIPSVAARARDLLPKGYHRIVGYECKQRGYEWFGGDPGHEALSAYGLLEFTDMAKVYDVDQGMVARTRQWLLSRRDGNGGFQRNARALDSFGRAPQTVTDPYIVHALLYSGTAAADLVPELDLLADRAATTADAYELALEACALQQGGRAEAAMARQRLATMQQADGSLCGATTSITSSGGSDLAVETTAFAVQAWLADAAFAGQARRSVDYLGTRKTASGTFGATQATICALRALTAYAQANRQMPEAGTVRIFAGDKLLAERAFAAGQPDAVAFDLFAQLAAGAHTLRIELQGGGEALPWACDLAYHSDRPADDVDAKVAITAALRQATVEEGNTVALDVEVQNRTQDGLPMTLAIVGIPAGLEVTTKVLDDCKRAGAFDLWELRGRELVLYWRGLAPAAQRRVSIDLLARIPGSSTGPASRAYLYYTPSLQRWAAPVTVQVTAAGGSPR